MAEKLGIVGAPADDNAMSMAAAHLGVTLVYLVDENSLVVRRPDHAITVAVSFADEALLVAQLAALDLSGLWVLDRRNASIVDPAAKRLGWPQLAGQMKYPEWTSPIPNGQTYSINALSRLVDTCMDSFPVPSWVRSDTGDGDTSCMRVEHPRDVSLALEKVRKRNPTGALRLQPAVDGTSYRLMAFKTGRDLLLFDMVEESVTTSVYRVPLSMSMPVPRRAALQETILHQARQLNQFLPTGWAYVEMEFVATDGKVVLTDVQVPSQVSEDLRTVVRLSQGVDLLQACMACALGRKPSLAPSRETGVALSWLLTRSGVVIAIEGVEAVRALPGVLAVQINAREGDILSHVVDLPSRGRGGYIVTCGATAEIAKARLDFARDQIGVHTSPALS